MPRFEPGQMVHHTRYDYRGLVVAYDPTCRAEDAWYLRNRTQPHRNQPWYHVVVDAASHMTYVAEENLEPDPLRTPVENPMLARFEMHYHTGRYYPQSLN